MKKLMLLLFFAAISLNLFAQDYCAGEITYYSIEEALESSKDVKKLDIALNKLTSISPDIAKLENLECLDLAFNRFSTLPDEMAELKNLKYLNLTGTRHLAGVPEVIKEIPNLEVLDIRDHPEWSQDVFDEAVKMLPDVKVITK